MTTPRLQAPALLDRALARQQARVGGMVRRGVVVAVNNLYRPAVVDVELEARIGAPSLVRGLSLVDQIFDWPRTPQTTRPWALTCFAYSHLAAPIWAALCWAWPPWPRSFSAP